MLSWLWMFLAFIIGVQCAVVENRQAPLNATAISTSSEDGRLPKVVFQPVATGFEEEEESPRPSQENRGRISQSTVPAATESFTQPLPSQATPGMQIPNVPQPTAAAQLVEKSSVPDAQTTGRAEAGLPVGVTKFNGQKLTPVPESTFIISGQTLSADKTITVPDTGVEIHLEDGSLVLEHQNEGWTIRSTVRTITPSPSIVAGYPLSMRGFPVVAGVGASATTYSIDNDGTTLAIVNGRTATLAPPLSQTVMFGGDITAVVSASRYQYLVWGSTLQVDHPVTIDGTALSLRADSSQTVLAVGSSTATLEPPTPIIDMDDGFKVTVVDGTTKYIIGDHTLGPGDGLSISAGAGKTVVAVGGQKTTMWSSPEESGWMKPGQDDRGGSERLDVSWLALVGMGALGLVI
ncbi:unnamed protein product [Periconia digitata]|uniref:FecR protein domain-containing protein n=1 Tax=Periconia digitata TaxID=1303443 RepID=A0A9W4XN07_9PLEO|nr:unnamed protein product [Periconia digitata]